jgi:hypothetical protein
MENHLIGPQKDNVRQKVPPILARSGEKMNFPIEKTRSTLTWVAGMA